MRQTLLIIFIYVLIFLPIAAGATHGGFHILHCGYGNLPECTSCDIFIVIHNLMNALWRIFSVPIATIMFMWGGGLMIFSGLAANPNLATRGRKILTNTLIGLVIIFFAWLGVDTIIKVLANRQVGGVGAIPVEPQRYGPWNEFRCDPAPQTSRVAPTPSTSTRPSVSSPAPQRPSPGDVSGTTCPTCVRISVPTKPGVGGACKDSPAGQICMVDNTLNERLLLLNRSLMRPGGYWWVTEAWPPTVTHQNPCHTSGTCVDANLRGGNQGSPPEISYFIQKAEQSGLKAVYEVKTSERKAELVKAGVREDAILVVSTITAEHFSIYLR